VSDIHIERRGKPWQELAKSKPFANEPFGLAGTLFRVQDIKRWREQEYEAGRPSGLDDFFRAQHLGYKFCDACESRGIDVHPVDWDGEIPLFEVCQICRGIGTIIDPSIETNDLEQP
jgi:hypothetical protein